MWRQMSQTISQMLNCSANRPLPLHVIQGFSLLVLVDPAGLVLLVRLDLTLVEPQINLFLGAFDAIRAVADIATNINSILTTNGAWG